MKRRRLGLVLLGNRIVAALVDGTRAETFVVEAEQASAALRAELDARHIDARAAALAVARTAVTVKPIELPAVDGDLAHMVEFELERHLPFRVEDASFDAVPLASEEEPQGSAEAGTRVLVVAAERRVVDGALRVAEEARLRPLSLTVAPLDLPALTRPTRGHVVWAHRSGDVVDLLFLANGTVVGSRAVPYTEDAAVASEIELSLGVMRWRGWDAIWVSGDDVAPGSALVRSLVPLGAPVTDPAWTSRATEWLRGVEQDQPGAAILAVATAVARGGRPLDLLPVPLRPKRMTRSQLVTLASCLVAVVVGLAALLVPGYRDARRLKAVNAEIARLDPQVRAVDRTLRELESQRHLLATIQAAEAAAIRPLPVLRDLTDLLPSDTWLTTMSLDAKGVELTGQAAAASGLIPLLENSPRLERVEFASPVTRGRDKEQFRIRAAWEGQGARLGPSPLATAPASPTPAAGAPGRQVGAASAPAAVPPAAAGGAVARPDRDGGAREAPPAAGVVAPQPRRPSPPNLITPGGGG